MKLLKVKDVTAKLGISRGKAYQMIRDGVIPSVNIDGCIRVPERFLDDMIYQQLLQAAGKDKTRVERINNLFGDRAERRDN
ncbi:MAG TPA: helix-turn-helix domain-containing protein [Bacillota bacterium]|nr:helix-turn-helix domain-containing protein [Bacillota bacterium]NMD34241.1 helix-turn-helix domain-containing protein [Bacillota bacterium]HOB28821.1 helix-turn-helix domain-containing protein [Bacillota bacterium]HQD51560.1 helix-turn-helix domain-containing protein [Bacillota bacterium]